MSAPRRGRRPAGSDARGDIVAAARAEFAERGYDATSLRAIARRAQVDSALVHHYFAGKSALFAEIMTIPVDPSVLVSAVVALPRERVGEALVRAFFELWDSPAGRARFTILARTVLTSEEAARMVREFLAREVLGAIATAYALPGSDPLDVERRASLAAAQLFGAAVLRYVVGFPGLQQAGVEDLIADLAPTIQRYLAP